MRIKLSTLRRVIWCEIIREAAAKPLLFTQNGTPIKNLISHSDNDLKGMWWISPEGQQSMSGEVGFYHEDLGLLADLGGYTDEEMFKFSDIFRRGGSLKDYLAAAADDPYSVDYDTEEMMNDILKKGYAKVRLWTTMGAMLSLGSWRLSDQHLNALKDIIEEINLHDKTKVDLSQNSPPKAISCTVQDVRYANSLSDLGW